MNKSEIVALLRRLISGIAENIVLFDEKGVILYVSANAATLFQLSEDTTCSIFDLLKADQEEVKSWLKHPNDSHFKDIRLRMIRGEEVFPAHLKMVAWSVSDDEFVVMASVTDCTEGERKRKDLLRKTLTIEQLSRSRKIRSGKLNDAILEILEMSSRALSIQRVNAWSINADRSAIINLGSYDKSVHGLVPQQNLERKMMPNYFRLFETEKIIISNCSQQSSLTSELLDGYLRPNNIQSMMDIPVRIEGEIVGVVCFEQVGTAKEWSLQDQKFGLIVAQMVSLALETYTRKLIQQELERALKQQERLFRETNHRIKNNLAITGSLMRMQLDKCRDDYHRSLIQDGINRIHSIAALHELLAGNNSGSRIDFEPYVQRLLDGLRESFSRTDRNVRLTGEIACCEIAGSLAITLGLIINEMVTNAYKHAFEEMSEGEISVSMHIEGPFAELTIKDSGKGFELVDTGGQGFEIIEGLAMHIDAEMQRTIGGGSGIRLRFRLK